MPWTKRFDIKKEVNKSLVDSLQAVAFRLYRGFILRTPVETGRLRNGWVIGINGINTSDTKSGEEFKIRAVKKATDVINISNNVPYIMYVEDAVNRNAPPGAIIQATITQENNRR